MKNSHYEIRFVNGIVINDYVSKTLNDVIRSIVNSVQFKAFELKEIVLIEE